MPGIGGNSLLFAASSIGFYPRFQFLTRVERHHPPSRNRDFFARFGIAHRTLLFVAEIEIAVASVFVLFTLLLSGAHFFVKCLDNILCLAFVLSKLFL